MKKLIIISLFTLFLTPVTYYTSYAQIDTTPVFEPVDDPIARLLNTDNFDYWIRTSAFMGTGSGGAELTFYSKEKPIFANVYFGMMANPENRIPDARTMRFGGFSLGIEKSLYLSNAGSQLHLDTGKIQSAYSGMRIYYRLGTGINFNIVERYNLVTGEQSRRLHPGIQTSGMVGVSTQVSRKLSLFMEMGGLLVWNQSIPTMRWWGRPYLTVGVSTASFW
ncbi:MAG: hypothetical protein R3220_02380 [Balneolaceae bacterium]|nr:hypothetical protein [Balneolaceae bacterium]